MDRAAVQVAVEMAELWADGLTTSGELSRQTEAAVRLP
jgi:hypothetical protein